MIIKSHKRILSVFYLIVAAWMTALGIGSCRSRCSDAASLKNFVYVSPQAENYR